jgi:hypothetical protein
MPGRSQSRPGEGGFGGICQQNRSAAEDSRNAPAKQAACTCRVCIARSLLRAQKRLATGRLPPIASDIINDLILNLIGEATFAQIEGRLPGLPCERLGGTP